jgi:hypothetical protein
VRVLPSETDVVYRHPQVGLSNSTQRRNKDLLHGQGSMKIYLKNRTYVPEVDIAEIFTDKTEDERIRLQQESRDYERTVNRLQVSKLRRRIEELTEAKWGTTEHQ